MAFSFSTRKTVAVLCSAALLAACGVQMDVDPPLTGESAGAVTVSAADTKAASAENLGERLTPGKGAAGGALAGAGAVLNSYDPYAILLLPIAVPVGALIGAAAAPSDERWAEMEAEHERKVSNIKQLLPVVDSVEKAGRLERLIAAQIRRVPELQSTCVRTRAQGRNCPVTQASPQLKMEMGHKIWVRKVTEGGLFTGKPKKSYEVYFISSRVDARLDMPAPQEDRCFVFGFGSMIRPDESGGKFDRKKVEADMDESMRLLAVRIVLSVFEAPGLDTAARNNLARKRQEELGLKYTPYPQYSAKCDAISSVQGYGVLGG